MSQFTILLGGDLVRTPVLDDQVAGTRVIAADSGIRHAELLGLTPELWVGDFDSVPKDLPPRLQSVPTRKFPAEKDKTDGELAIDIAREKGATSLILAGAFGGLRADHAFLHLALALRLAENGVSVLLTSGAQEGVPLLNRSAEFDYGEGTMFSIHGFSDLAGLTVEGARWPLANVEVPFGSSLTISNAVAGKLRIQLASGRALLVAHPFPISGS
ncbi:thiamine pyrophosphokinase [Mesorhizobium sp. Root157]|uniref:thiamine diphosphokinase n=1 Tax=Mesorhizobium sp. Root157 TaxID=1736477 RepID=UPI0006FA5F23|nr:thiamine diphosphokinase [Mesorhizobium sp. Root157]KRA00372.1 thiamine pyrophosphokinase [Mesorhizobium sp. Root157]